MGHGGPRARDGVLFGTRGAMIVLRVPGGGSSGRLVHVMAYASRRERFLDAQPSSPKDHDQAAEPSAAAVSGGAHDRDDLLDFGRIGWVTQALVARRATREKPRHRRWRTATTGTIALQISHGPHIGLGGRTRASSAADARLGRDARFADAGVRALARAGDGEADSSAATGSDLVHAEALPYGGDDR
jgi:hypothetical protein